MRSASGSTDRSESSGRKTACLKQLVGRLHTAAMEDLEEDLTCSVCYSLFCDPRVLPCSHTFCKACLDRVLLSSVNYSVWRPRPLKCPNCRSLVELAPPGVEALPVNVSLRAIVEKYQKERPPAPSCCPEHPHQPLNVYCVQDRQPVCGLCLTVGRHQGHAIDDLHAAFLRERQTLGQLLAALSEQRLAQVCELGQQLDQGKAQCEGLLRADRLAVEQYFQELELTLRRKKEACLVALEAASADVDRAYNPLIVSARSLAEEHCDLLTLGASVQEEDRPLEFLEQVHLLRERVERLTALPLPPAAAPSVAPRAGDFLRERWALVGLGALGEAPVPWVGCGPQGEGPGAEAGPAATGGTGGTDGTQGTRGTGGAGGTGGTRGTGGIGGTQGTGGTGGTEDTGGTDGTQCTGGTGGIGGSQGTGGTEGLDQEGPESLPVRLCLAVGLWLLISLAGYCLVVCGDLWEDWRSGLTTPIGEEAVMVHTQIQRTMEVLLQAVEDLFMFLNRPLFPG